MVMCGVVLQFRNFTYCAICLVHVKCQVSLANVGDSQKQFLHFTYVYILTFMMLMFSVFSCVSLFFNTLSCNVKHTCNESCCVNEIAVAWFLFIYLFIALSFQRLHFFFWLCIILFIFPYGRSLMSTSSYI